jgi:putative oxidoreductase
VASAFAIFCVLTAVLFHAQFADSNQLLHFQKDLAIAGGFLVLAVSGPGTLSADRYIEIYYGAVARPAQGRTQVEQ